MHLCRHCSGSLPLLLESLRCIYHWPYYQTCVLEQQHFKHLVGNWFVNAITECGCILNSQIGSIHFSILAGRILLKDVRYHSSNQTIKVVKGQISWRYWIRRPTTEDDISNVGGEACMSSVYTLHVVFLNVINQTNKPSVHPHVVSK
jgi:hypothetical protein